MRDAGGHRGRGLTRSIDWSLVICWLLLILIGWANIYASVHSSEPSSIFDFTSRSGKQFVWMVTALGIAVTILFIIPPRTYEGLSLLIYLGVIALLVAVIFLGIIHYIHIENSEILILYLDYIRIKFVRKTLVRLYRRTVSILNQSEVQIHIAGNLHLLGAAHLEGAGGSLAVSVSQQPLAVVLGLGAGAIDSGLNNYVALNFKASHMNFLHCFYGVGVSLSPYIMSQAFSNVGWRGGYRYAFYVQFAIALLLIFSLPLWKKNSSTKDSDEESGVTLSIAEMIKKSGFTEESRDEKFIYFTSLTV